MNIILPVSQDDLKTSGEILEGFTSEELAHKFVLFLSSERKLAEWRDQRYSTDTRSLVEAAQRDAEAEKNNPDYQESTVRDRFMKTCQTIAKKIHHD